MPIFIIIFFILYRIDYHYEKKFEFEKDKDVSTKHMSFEELEHYSIRNVLRDIYDQFLRRPFYFLNIKIFLNIKSIE